MDDATPIDDGVYALGPVGIWPLKYRVKLIDKKNSQNVDSDWNVVLEKRVMSSGLDWKYVLSADLFPDGSEYENRTKKP